MFQVKGPGERGDASCMERKKYFYDPPISEKLGVIRLSDLVAMHLATNQG